MQAGSAPPSEPDPLHGHPKYEQVRVLGKGGFGQVLLARNRHTDEYVAIKLIKRGAPVTKYVLMEILNHRMLYHAHVIQFHEVFVTDQYLCIAMEYAAGGTILNYIREHNRLKEPIARRFFQQLVLGLDYCHRKGVVNRDIKLENTLLDRTAGSSRKPFVKMCDFGYSKNLELQSAPHSRVGTPNYLAPEVVAARPNQAYDAQRSDVWSCGVMLYAMVVGTYPFESSVDRALPTPERLRRLMLRIVSGEFTFPAHVDLSAGCRDLIARVLVTDPGQRLTLAQICTHDWFREGLPATYSSWNDNPAPLPDTLQSEEVVRQVVEAARQLPRAPWLASPGEQLSENMADAIDNEIDNYRSDDYSGHQA